MQVPSLRECPVHIIDLYIGKLPPTAVENDRCLLHVYASTRERHFGTMHLLYSTQQFQLASTYLMIKLCAKQQGLKETRLLIVYELQELHKYNFITVVWSCLNYPSLFVTFTGIRPSPSSASSCPLINLEKHQDVGGGGSTAAACTSGHTTAHFRGEHFLVGGDHASGMFLLALGAEVCFPRQKEREQWFPNQQPIKANGYNLFYLGYQ